MRRPILILGGMGPQASVRLHQLILEASRPYHDGNNDDYPHIVHMSLPITDFMSNETSRKQGLQTFLDLEPQIRLCNPSFVVLACNTAHLLIPDLPYMQELSFLPLIDTIVEAVQCMGLKQIGLLASPTTIRTKLYERPLHVQGIKVLNPDSKERLVIETAIRGVIAMNTTKGSSEEIADIAESLVAKGAEAIILGCTELPLVYEGTELKVPVFDCLKIYAETVVRNYYLYNGGRYE